MAFVSAFPGELPVSIELYIRVAFWAIVVAGIFVVAFKLRGGRRDSRQLYDPGSMIIDYQPTGSGQPGRKVLRISLITLAFLFALGMTYMYYRNPQPAAEVEPEACSSGMTEYSVQDGDTLSSIGQAKGVDWTGIRAVGRDLVEPFTIFTGEVLCLPGDGYVAGQVFQETAEPETEIESSPAITSESQTAAEINPGQPEILQQEATVEPEPTRKSGGNWIGTVPWKPGLAILVFVLLVYVGWRYWIRGMPLPEATAPGKRPSFGTIVFWTVFVIILTLAVLAVMGAVWFMTNSPGT
ncbi:hypothetical protein A2Z33_00425 [Candidatus Gottesmanbacteria bacterium RBG_16_52_11]|uniref:LysM domain-containing protein n=1 Tax=Candidatus Gottesmanbacteria bacterium RBG_16_52_11 TaxID=1798374 RepID=A0A1F5YMW4_9BACT|nr:MAG: hypothetical protein A2Z33_00425 [Candidatus Gottesmanbacteria bacterium RBG_16_52_11]